jgi:uncharacterized membrane protein YraQ (UPF0718 family)
MEHFFHVFLHYTAEILPALAAGFFISGIVHELIPEDAVLRHLGSRGIVPILAATIVGTLLPVCCWGSLPIAISFYKKGARLGPVLAFLVATPATSISALFVSYSVLGGLFTVYIFFAVITMGILMGLIGNASNHLTIQRSNDPTISWPHCELDPEHRHLHVKKTASQKFISAMKYAFIELPKEIGLELLVGLVLAAVVATFNPLGRLIKTYLGGWFGYAFAIVFGILMYICSTATVPLVDSMIRQGMSPGAGMTLLLIGPVTSYGTILVLRKEYGTKILAIFLLSLIVMSLALGLGFQALRMAV